MKVTTQSAQASVPCMAQSSQSMVNEPPPGGTGAAGGLPGRGVSDAVTHVSSLSTADRTAAGPPFDLTDGV
jgi:hypothetical protein